MRMGRNPGNCLQVRDALCKKVSRERVGAELEGMFNGALALLSCFSGLAGGVALPGQQHALASIQDSCDACEALPVNRRHKMLD